MAVNLSEPSSLLSIKGVRLASAHAGIRYKDRDDMVLIHCHPDSVMAGVFTQNKFCAAPVEVAKSHLSSGQALLINAGNANAGTGQQGLNDALYSCELVAKQLGLASEQVLPFSTGVIGQPLPMQKVKDGIKQLTTGLSEQNWLPAAKAIMTTDTVAKGVSKTIQIDGQTISLTAIAKGSGMICPNMATMLAYVASDVCMSDEVLQALLKEAVSVSFNAITVDGDTSTNDALIAIASNQSNISAITSISDPRAAIFANALQQVCIELAGMIVRDAEGATKFVTIEVNGGLTKQDCESVAFTVAHSPLVKTALFASDPNWGRILAAVGRAPIECLDIGKVSIWIGGVALIKDGEPDPSYTEEQGQGVFSNDEITIKIDLGLGQISHRIWTSDLSNDYVSINADYRS